MGFNIKIWTSILLKNKTKVLLFVYVQIVCPTLYFLKIFFFKLCRSKKLNILESYDCKILQQLEKPSSFPVETQRENENEEFYLSLFLTTNLCELFEEEPDIMMWFLKFCGVHTHIYIWAKINGASVYIFLHKDLYLPLLICVQTFNWSNRTQFEC